MLGAEQEEKTSPDDENAGQREKQRKLPWFRQPVPIDRFTGWLVAWTALLFIATIINAAILAITDHTLNVTLENNNRAWIAPHEAALLATPAVGMPIEAELRYRNSGQSPALKINFGMEIRPMEMEKPFLVWDACEGVPYPGPTALFPATSVEAAGFPDSKRAVAGSGLIAGTRTMVWRGCFLYETYSKRRSLRFCYWLRKDGGRWFWQSCGIEAD